jgi:hypothetical protein
MAEGSDSPEALMLVPCRECAHNGIENMFARKALVGHLGPKHPGMKKADYIAKFGPESENDFWKQQKSTEERQMLSNRMRTINEERKRSSSNSALESLAAANREGLDIDEQEFYDEFFEQIFQQTDRDEMQIPIITSLAMDHIMVKRMRNRLLDKKKIKTEDIVANVELEKQLKTTEERISKTMDALGISRAAQLKRGAIIKSTPASLISGYLDEIERMSPEMLEAFQLEERRVYAKMMPRIEKFILSEAPDIEKEDESDEGSGKPLSLEEALGRAGIVAGGGYTPPESTESERDLPF